MYPTQKIQQTQHFKYFSLNMNFQFWLFKYVLCDHYSRFLLVMMYNIHLNIFNSSWAHSLTCVIEPNTNLHVYLNFASDACKMLIHVHIINNTNYECLYLIWKIMHTDTLLGLWYCKHTVWLKSAPWIRSHRSV